MDLTFYDKKGIPVAYTEDLIHIYLFDGEPVAYIDSDSIYSYSGKHLGWFEEGWVISHSGQYVFFTEIASKKGPNKPIQHAKPLKHAKKIKTIRSVKDRKPVKPTKHLVWSELSGKQFFYQ